MPRSKRQNKGFKRSKREWEESIAGHVGRAIDRVPIIDAILYSIAAYYGHIAAEKMGGKFPDTLAGSAIAMISLRLATSRNLAAGTAGTAGLVGVGLATGIGQEILAGADQVVSQIEAFWRHIIGVGA